MVIGTKIKVVGTKTNGCGNKIWLREQRPIVGTKI
jgi:hypothetical protein